MKRIRSIAALVTCTLLCAGSSAPEPTKPVRFAVVAVGQCSAASSAITARSFRALLQPRLGATLQSEADTAKAFGGLSERTLEEVERAVAAARKDFYAHHVDVAVGHLKELAVNIRQIAPSEGRWKVERDLLTLLAQAELISDAQAAELTLVSILSVEPAYQPDTGLYPPSFRKFVDGVRVRQAELPTNRLDVAVAPSEVPVYVGGRPIGVAPVSHHFPAGEYRVEADFGHRGLVRTVLVPAPPALVAPVQLAVGIEGSLFADGGPCVEPGLEGVVSLARVTTLVGATRLIGIHKETSASIQWIVVEMVDATGSPLRSARVRILPSAPETDGLAALAEWTATDHAAAAVEVLKHALPPGAETGRGHFSGTVLGQPRPNGFLLKTFPLSGQVTPGPGVHFSGDKFKNVDEPSGKSSIRVLTDDGRVGTTLVDVPRSGSVDVSVHVDPACTAAGRVVNGSWKPVTGAHLVAQLLGTRISQSVGTGPKGRFILRELTRGSYDLTVDFGVAHVVRRFTVGADCAADLGTLTLLNVPAASKLSADGGTSAASTDH